MISVNPTLLERLERYYDAVPRSSARAEDFGPLTLFHREGPDWPFYARPALGGPGQVTAADVDRVRARQRELGVPESFEWMAETAPALRAAAEESGLTVHEHPVMVLDPRASEPGRATAPEPDSAPDSAPAHVGGAVVRMLGPDDPLLGSALAVPHLAFAAPGGPAGADGGRGIAELDRLVRERAGDGSVERTAERVRRGLTRIAAAVEDGRALCAGQHQPVGTVSEIVGVGTLPAARRRGLGLAVTAALAADALAGGAETVFLAAGDEDVARLYARLGFRRTATALIAEPDS
ncbi:GNAT family N-acetyltransferase [Streptomyces sp. NPDC020141]|uniref:GNAT family N-acetyltransferase n=1 Tax=Streptomyces sp. NPDC020141 TaxID=3365065 RepID=UPI0037BD4663